MSVVMNLAIGDVIAEFIARRHWQRSHRNRI